MWKYIDKSHQRKSNIEAFRILCVLMILMGHCTWAAGGISGKMGAGRLIMVALGSWQMVGVYGYVLVSAYFLRNAQFKKEKFWALLAQTLFYMLPYTVLYLLSGGGKNGIISYLKRGMIDQQLFTTVYWFPPVYLILYLLFPYINKFMDVLTKKELNRFMGICTFILLVFFPYVSWGTFASIIWLTYIYMVQVFICKTESLERFVNKYAVQGAIICTFTLVMIKFIMPILPKSLYEIVFYIFNMRRDYSFVLLIEAIFLFRVFLKFRMKDSKVINKVASTVFGIYLFHEHADFNLRYKLMDALIDRFGEATVRSTWGMPIFCTFATLILFIGGVMVDGLRQLLFRRRKIAADIKNIKDEYYDDQQT